MALQIYPDWNIKDYMLVTNVHNLLRYESYVGNNRPMTHYVEQPHEIDSVFDDISYSKGNFNCVVKNYCSKCKFVS